MKHTKWSHFILQISVVSLFAATGALMGCIDGPMDASGADMYESNTLVPPVDMIPTRPEMTSSDKVVDQASPRIIIYKDYNAWFSNENRDEATLTSPPFNFTRDEDYAVLPMTDLASGVPKGAEVVIITSNSFGVVSTALAQRLPFAQFALQNFLQESCSATLVVHTADNSPQGLGYLAPGLSGPRTLDGNTNTMRLVPSISGQKSIFEKGPDGMADTADDATESSIQFLAPFDRNCCAHQGSLAGALPPNAKILLEGDNGEPIYAEYPYGKGRVIIGTLTFEFGFEGIVGQTNRMLINHFWNAIVEVDRDCDGVRVSTDCDDNDAGLGELLYAEGIDANYFVAPAQLDDDPWTFENGQVTATGGSQQALLGPEQDWEDVAVFATLSAAGTLGGCCGNEGETNRWRGGVILRGERNDNQDEGFHGYRCAVASNAETVGGVPHSGPSTGQFLQLAEFMDGAEDETGSECEGGHNTTFQELARTRYDFFDFAGGAKAHMTFYAIGNSLHCSITDGSGTVSASAIDNSFTRGTVGLSTLNLLGNYETIRVCAAKATE